MEPASNNQYPPIETAKPSDNQPLYPNNPPMQQGYPNQPPQYPQYPPQYPNNPQYPNYPPQQYPPQQYPPQQYPPQQFPHQPGYLPPNQYVVLADQDNQQNSAQAQTNKRIMEIERTLNQGGYRCYVIWLYFLAVMGILDLVQTFIGSITYGLFGPYVPSFICSIWLAYQSLLEINAIQRRNLRSAQRALVLMIIFAVLNLAAIITLAVVGPSLYDDYYDDDYYYNWEVDDILRAYFTTLVVLYSISLVVHVCVTIVGAVSVRRVLRERKVLQDSMRPAY